MLSLPAGATASTPASRIPIVSAQPSEAVVPSGVVRSRATKRIADATARKASEPSTLFASRPDRYRCAPQVRPTSAAAGSAKVRTSIEVA
jgi:hypothetical protein